VGLSSIPHYRPVAGPSMMAFMLIYNRKHKASILTAFIMAFVVWPSASAFPPTWRPCPRSGDASWPRARLRAPGRAWSQVAKARSLGGAPATLWPKAPGRAPRLPRQALAASPRRGQENANRGKIHGRA
jgi:hypothetical protein